MKNRPPYAIDSVDHALHLAALLQQEGPLRVTDAAERLGVSRSTAHRLLAMLVYRDFAEQTDDRRYRPGSVLRLVETSEAPVTLLRRTSLPHLRALTDAVGESTNLVVPASTEVRFVATVEASQVLRVGDRVGRALPAHLASGGKALLATLTAEELTALYDGSAETVDLPRLRRELSLVRKRGFAINDRRTEAGVTAIGKALHDPGGHPCAAISIALPTARFDKDQIPRWVGALSDTVTGVERDLSANA